MTIETWMHDVFFQKNFDDLDNYLSFEEMSSQLPFPIMVVGNKSDLISNDEVSCLTIYVMKYFIVISFYILKKWE